MVEAKYTIVLKTLLDDSLVKAKINTAMSTYPMYEPTNPFAYTVIPTRDQLNNKILNHYKYREIGFETPGRFIEELQTTLEEIMPYYYQMFKSEDIMNEIEDPFGNVDVTETTAEETLGSASVESSGTASNVTETSADNITSAEVTNTDKTVKSQTPQNELSITASNIDNVSYADEVNWNKNQSNSEGTNSDESSATSESSNSGSSESESTENKSITYHKKGNQGVNTYAHDINELRESFRKVVEDIINNERLSELFLRVF